MGWLADWLDRVRCGAVRCGAFSLVNWVNGWGVVVLCCAAMLL